MSLGTLLTSPLDYSSVGTVDLRRTQEVAQSLLQGDFCLAQSLLTDEVGTQRGPVEGQRVKTEQGAVWKSQVLEKEKPFFWPFCSPLVRTASSIGFLVSPIRSVPPKAGAPL